MLGIGEAPRICYSSAHQGLLETVLRSILSGQNVVINARKDAQIKNPATGFYLEVDIWLPALNLCFEFQDAYHYGSAWDSHVPQSDIEKKDALKKEKLIRLGATLITVPCWWDGSAESLVHSILFYRPDLVHLLPSKNPTVLPMCLNSRLDYFSVRGVPEVGELMLASFPIALQPGLIVDIEHPWWVGEKYDGIRGCWQPNVKKIFTRSGRELFIPEFFYDLFPEEGFLDGEFWLGRGSFAEVQQILAMDIHALDWSMLRFVGFDNAAPYLNEIPFEERYMYLLDSFTGSNIFVINAFRVWMLAKRTLHKMRELILHEGGEGLIMRLPDSPYIGGRSPNLIKIKASRADKEALVIEITDDYVVLQQPDGATFNVPQKEEAKNGTRLQLKRGDVVMFTYENVSPRAVPVNPKIARIRSDRSWEEVLFSETLEYSLDDVSRNFPGTNFETPLTKSKGEMRAIFERFMREKNLDPRIPEHLYAVSRLDFMQFKGGRSTLANYEGSLVKALLDLFPELDLEERKFEFISRNYWGNIDNRRQVFLDFAKENGFDPYVAKNWYAVTMNKFRGNKRTTSVLQLYNDNSVKALLHLFPEIGLRASKFVLQPRKYWIDIENAKLFTKYANFNGFDPLVPGNWYSQTKESLLSIKGANNILQYYEGSFITALQRVFPEIKLDPSKFGHLSDKKSEGVPAFISTHWQRTSNRRNLLELIAKDKGFDPLIPSNWYSINPDDVLSYKGASSMLFYYAGSIVKALVELFPEVRFDKSQFTLVRSKYWLEADHRTKLLQFAATQGIDHLNPEQWYPIISRQSIQTIQGLQALLSHYQGSIVKALIHLFPNVPFDTTRFAHLPGNHLSRDYRRTFFEKFAAKANFDALIPEHWYKVSDSQILQSKMVYNIVEYYGSLGKSLSLLFPEVVFNHQLFQVQPNKSGIGSTQHQLP